MTTTTTTRPVLDIAKWDEDGCPDCGSSELISVDRTVRFWEGGRVIEGVLCFDGHYEVGDDGTDEHLSCVCCGAEFAIPERVDYL